MSIQSTMPNLGKNSGTSKIAMINLGKKTLLLTLLIFVIMAIVITIGAFCYKLLFKMSYVDAYYNSMLTASTLGVDPHTKTTGEKMFTGFYGLFCAVLLIAFISTIVAYLSNSYYEVFWNDF